MRILHPPKLLIILQALLFGTVIRAGSNRSVDPLIERLSVQKLEPLGWLKKSRREVEEKSREWLPASSGLVKSYHNLEGKHKAYISLQVRAPSKNKLLRVNKRAAPFTEQQLHQLNQEQSEFSPSQPNSIADNHKKWSTLAPDSSTEKMTDFFDSSGESWSTTSFTQQGAQDNETQVLPVPNSSPQANVEVESYDGLPETELSRAEGAIEALGQEAHFVNTLVNSLVSNVSLEGSQDFFNIKSVDGDENKSIEFDSRDSDIPFNSHTVEKNPLSPLSSRVKPHRIVNEIIPKSEQVSSIRSIGDVKNESIPVIIIIPCQSNTTYQDHLGS